MKTLLLIFIFPVLAFAGDAASDGKANENPSYAVPAENKALPLEWRGTFISLDAANRFDNRFVKMDFGFSVNAVIGYKQYDFRFETIAPLSSQGFSYRLRVSYQLF